MVWLHVMGVGDNGLASLQAEALAALNGAELAVAGERLLELLPPDIKAERLCWPRPFNKDMDFLRPYAGRQVAVLVTGDPLWYSAGARIARAFRPDEAAFYPQVSAFQMAACRMLWSLPDVTCETIHGRPVSQIEPLLGDGQNLLLLAWDRQSPHQLAAFLSERGFGASTITALCHMGGADEKRFAGRADDWRHEVDDFHLLAVSCRSDGSTPTLGRLPGLADERFVHDGQLTRRDVRALTLSRLRPMQGELLWDIGCGCGSVAIEWMRAARNARAVGVERNGQRLKMARANADRLGAARLRLIEGEAAEIFRQGEDPHAIFFGGGANMELLGGAIERLRPNGRLVCNAVTVETERLLFDARQRWGGELSRVATSELAPLGALHGWRPARAVSQWSFIK